jgi:hypothetical protein
MRPGTADPISGKFKGFGAKTGLNWNYLDCGLIPRKLRGSLTKLPWLKGYLLI